MAWGIIRPCLLVAELTDISVSLPYLALQKMLLNLSSELNPLIEGLAAGAALKSLRAQLAAIDSTIPMRHKESLTLSTMGIANLPYVPVSLLLCPAALAILAPPVFELAGARAHAVSEPCLPAHTTRLKTLKHTE
jgi:hypothetical protein